MSKVWARVERSAREAVVTFWEELRKKLPEARALLDTDIVCRDHAKVAGYKVLGLREDFALQILGVVEAAKKESGGFDLFLHFSMTFEVSAQTQVWPLMTSDSARSTCFLVRARSEQPRRSPATSRERARTKAEKKSRDRARSRRQGPNPSQTPVQLHATNVRLVYAPHLEAPYASRHALRCVHFDGGVAPGESSAHHPFFHMQIAPIRMGRRAYGYEIDESAFDFPGLSIATPRIPMAPMGLGGVVHMILRDHARRVLPDWPKIVGHLHSVGVHDISNASFARKHQPYKGVESWYP